MTEPQPAIDLGRLIVLDPRVMPTFDCDLEDHADSLIALLQQQGHAPINCLGHVAGLLAMAEAT
jgi:hypothetical protein